MYDPLLNNSSDQPWAPPTPPSVDSPQVTRSQPHKSVDRRAMLEQLKSERQSTAPASGDSPATSVASHTTKKSPRPARAAKILVFGLSTTAMFGAITGYALADIQQQQKPVPTQPVVAPVSLPAVPTGNSSSNNQTQTVTPESTSPASTKKVANTTPAASDPVVPTPTDAVTTAPANADTVVVDIPVPQAAQPGQGQTSGGNQQSSGSH